MINKQLDHSAKKGDAYYTLDHQRVMQGRSVLVLSEGELTHLEEHIAKLKARKAYIINKVLQFSVFSTDMIQKFRRFHTWKSRMQFLKERQQHLAMVRVQTRARVWLCRVSFRPVLLILRILSTV